MADGHRSIKELLKIMLDNKQLFHTGLCRWAWKLRRSHIITSLEFDMLSRYIDNNGPWFGLIRRLLYDGYYWYCGDMDPRIKWIEKHIKKNSQVQEQTPQHTQK